MKTKIEIKHRYSGEVLFSHEQEDNTLRITVEKAIKERVNLRGSNLRDSNLSGSDLRYSDLRNSDLSGSNLSYSDLRGSNLRDSNLRDSDLSGSNLCDSNLCDSNLRCSDLSGSDLRYSDLRCSDLRGAKNLSSAKNKNPAMLLMAYHDINDEICLELMRYDCANLPHGKKLFSRWVKDGTCPYNNNDYSRVAIFYQEKKLWKYGKSKTALQIWQMIEKDNAKKKKVQS